MMDEKNMAQLFQENGWGPGTVVRRTDLDDRYVVTAVGQDIVLLRHKNGFEGAFKAVFCEWVRCPDETPPPPPCEKRWKEDWCPAINDMLDNVFDVELFRPAVSRFLKLANAHFVSGRDSI